MMFPIRPEIEGEVIVKTLGKHIDVKGGIDIRGKFKQMGTQGNGYIQLVARQEIGYWCDINLSKNDRVLFKGKLTDIKGDLVAELLWIAKVKVGRGKRITLSSYGQEPRVEYEKSV